LKCRPCKGKGWLFTAGLVIEGSRAQMGKLIKLAKEGKLVELQVQRCDACSVFESDEEAREKAEFLVEVELKVLIGINGYLNQDTLIKALTQGAGDYILQVINKDQTVEYMGEQVENWLEGAQVIERITEGV
jgi:hypothetical protein